MVVPNEADLAAARADSAAASSTTQPALLAAAALGNPDDDDNDDDDDSDYEGSVGAEAYVGGKANVGGKGKQPSRVPAAKDLPPSSARWSGKGRGRGLPAGGDAVPQPCLPPALDPALARSSAPKKLSVKDQARADIAAMKLVEAQEYARLKAGYDDANRRGDYDAVRAEVAASPRGRLEVLPHSTPPGTTAVPTTDEWALLSLAQKRLWLFGHYDGDLKWRAALNGGKATKAHCDAAHKTALDVARSLAVVLAPRGTGARDPDANDPKKGPAEHAALLRARRGDGQPVAADMAEDRVAWISRHFKTYYADKKLWFKEWPGMLHSTALLVPNHTHAAIQPIHPPYLCADDDLYNYMKAVHDVVVKFVTAVSSSKTRRATLLDTLTVFITNENNSTPQRSEQREVAQFAVDYMIRSYLTSNSGLVGDSVSLMSRCWVWPRMPIDIPDINFVRDTLYPFYDLALPPQASGLTKQRKTAPDPLKKLCVNFVGELNERWVENTTPEFDPTLKCGACNDRMRFK